MSPQLFSTNAKEGDQVTEPGGGVWVFTKGIWTRGFPAEHKPIMFCSTCTEPLEKCICKRLVGMELIGVRSQYATIRYTRWPGSFAAQILSCDIPDGFKRGDRVRLGTIPANPPISSQVLKYIGMDLMIATEDKTFLSWDADAHWLMMDGGLFDLKKESWLVW